MNSGRNKTKWNWTIALVVCGLGDSLVACSSPAEIVMPVDIDPVEWEACDEFPGDDTVECGTVTVPLDYRNPDEQTIDIALLRYPAQSSKAKGVLLVNDGGPGSSGVDFAYYSGPDMIDSLGLEDFDIVGFDPRGVDRSGGLKCQTDDETDRFMYLDYRRCTTSGSRRRIRAWSSTARNCAITPPRTSPATWIRSVGR
jgi:pimeloyl-ACP methyl ester carboxylesterase